MQMFTKNSDVKMPAEETVCKEGELYKTITAFGKTFEIYYGYYEEKDRYSQYNEPMEIYPNFINEPVYTDEGMPFATAMQKQCEHFKGEPDEDNTCYQCAYFEKCEELLGVCNCAENKKISDNKCRNSYERITYTI